MDYQSEAKKLYERSKKFKKVLLLLSQCKDLEILENFDSGSLKMLDLKIKVLEQVNSGKSEKEIGDNYYKILENYPKE